MRLHCSRVGPWSNVIGFLMSRRQCEDTGTQGECHVITKAETGNMQLQAKELQGLPAKHQRLERGKEGFPYRLQKEHGPVDTLTLDFQAPAL